MYAHIALAVISPTVPQLFLMVVLGLLIGATPQYRKKKKKDEQWDQKTKTFEIKLPRHMADFCV